jgi:hypothetical protein
MSPMDVVYLLAVLVLFALGYGLALVCRSLMES